MRVFVRAAKAAALISLAALGCTVSPGSEQAKNAAPVGATPVLRCESPNRDGESLTGNGYTGSKYYFGWGVNDNGDPEMDNEVQYDVIHTHDIFTKAVGGNYIGSTLIGDVATGDAIKSQWQALTSKMTAGDMYLQYSSGHGYPGGLEAGVDYDDIIDAALAMPAKEIVIFTMACYSGGLVDAFNAAKDRWAGFAASGRTLFVMASSEADEELRALAPAPIPISRTAPTAARGARSVTPSGRPSSGMPICLPTAATATASSASTRLPLTWSPTRRPRETRLSRLHGHLRPNPQDRPEAERRPGAHAPRQRQARHGEATKSSSPMVCSA